MNDVRWVLDQDGLLTISGKGYAHTPIYHERCMEFGTIAEKYPIRRVVVEDGVTVLAAGLFQYLSSLESVEIAPSVVSWGNGLFSGCTALKEVRGGGKLRTIPALCFSGCGELNTFEIADSVRSIGLEAFHACSSLVFPALPEKIIEIENDAFSSCGGFPYLTITKDMEIGEYAFADMTVLEEVVIEEGVTAIGPGWFSNCTSLHSVTLPGSLRIIDWYAFEGTKNLRKIVLPPSLTTIGDGAFSRSALEEIEVPASVRVISTEAFGFCLDLKKVTLHEGLERIGPTAFDTDGQIESLKVPASVKQVGSYLFAESTGIHEVIFLGDPKEITFGTEEYLMGPFTESQLQTITFLDKDGNQLDPASFLGE